MALELIPADESDNDNALVPLPSAGPEPLLRGKFAFFETPEGGIHLVAKIEGQDKEIHQEVPKMALKMFGGRGKLSQMFGGE